MRKATRGFTLLEIMVVVILISLLASTSTVLIMKRFERAKINLARADIKGRLTQALGQYYLDNGFYPTTEQGLEALVEKPAGAPEPANYDEDGYVEDYPLDPWDMPYGYACPGTHRRGAFDLWSAGPDRQTGTDDDIVNWRRS